MFDHYNSRESIFTLKNLNLYKKAGKNYRITYMYSIILSLKTKKMKKTFLGIIKIFCRAVLGGYLMFCFDKSDKISQNNRLKRFEIIHLNRATPELRLFWKLLDVLF